jgi:hypothetical protein
MGLIRSMSMADDFKTFQPGLESPAEAGSALSPSDVAPLAKATRAIYIGGGGNLRVTLLSGDTVTFVGVLPGMIYPLRIAQVLATGTTATGLVGLR